MARAADRRTAELQGRHRRKSDRQERRRRAILEAATKVFLERGYEGATIDSVIDRVGGSKQTIYASFGPKKKLFGAVIAHLMDGVMVPGDIVGADVEATLLTVAGQYAELVLSPAGVALYRAVAAESGHFPERRAAFLGSSPGRVRDQLARYFGAQKALGSLDLGDPGIAAAQFLGMLRGDIHLRAVLDPRFRPNRSALDRSNRQAVATFLDGSRPQGRKRATANRAPGR